MIQATMVRSGSPSPWTAAVLRLSVTFAALLLLLGAVTATAAPASAAPPGAGGGIAGYSGDLTAGQLGLLLDSGVDRREVLTTPGAEAGTVRVEVVLDDRQAESLIAGGVPLTRRGAAARTLAAAPGVFRPWSGAGGLREEFVALARANPGLVKTVVLGRSVNGQDILAFKVTKDANRVPDGRRPTVVYVSTQHAREWITPEMTRRLLRHYLDTYRTDREIRRLVDTTELWFVPVANPDGYDFTFSTERLWRKNLRDIDGDGQIAVGDGVDPNRNYPTRWGYDNEGSSPSPSNDTYRGPAPASEPETRALDGLFRRITPELLVNYHSAAELLLYGTGWQVATPTPDDLVYETMVGDDANPAVPGFDPDISAELYTTNGETTEHMHETYGTLSFTPEMSTCQTASAEDPADAFEPGDCPSVFHFPDSEPLVQAEFARNLPFALSVARSAADPDDPVSVVGRTAPDFAVDAFTVSYGDPQTVAVTARRDIRNLELHYRIAGGREQRARVTEWAGGERYGDDGEVYYGEFRGLVRGARVGQAVEVWFTGNRPGRGRVTSERFTYTLAQDGNDVLVLANEDYEGFNPGEPAGEVAPRYAQQYVDALAANGRSAAVWDVSAQGVPHDLGVLGHFGSVVWYLGDNRLTQDAEDVLTDTFAFGPLEDLSVAERQQYLTIAVRDYLNGGGKLALTGETTGYYGQLGTALGGIYYGRGGAPDQDCVVTDDFFSDCLLLADDFTQYYLGAFDRSVQSAPPAFAGTADPLTGVTAALAGPPANPIDEAGEFTATSSVLPVEQFPQFASRVAGTYTGGGPGIREPIEGDWFVTAAHQDDSYMRLTRTVDLTGVTAAQAPTLRFALAYDMETGYDNVVLEANTVGGTDFTTLPEAGGLSTTTPPTECEVGFLLDLHPSLERYLTRGNPCGSTGSSGAWNAITGTSAGYAQVAYDLSAYAGRQVQLSISYVTDPSTGGIGVSVDDTRLVVGGAVAEAEGFETGLGPWTIPGAPEGSPPNAGDFVRSQAVVNAAGAAVATEDSVLLGFGLEQVPDAAERAALLGAILRGLAGTAPAAPAAPAVGPVP